MFLPTGKITVLTYRLEKYREQTEKFLKDMGLEFSLHMFPSDSYDERAKVSPSVFKGVAYRDSKGFLLFVESDDDQARAICSISNKPVFCVKTNTMYNAINELPLY